MKNQNNEIKILFQELKNRDVDYVILRNWENFYDDLFIEGHNDIDILCKNEKHKKKIINIFDAQPAKNNFYNSKYFFVWLNKKIYLDFRVVGDGYYCKRWEKNMLESKVLNEKGFYSLNQNDYFYSLIYHAMIHKGCLINDYRSVLNSIKQVDDFETELIHFMKANKYFLSVPLDKYVGQYNIKKFSKYLLYKREFCSLALKQIIRITKHLQK